VSAAKINQLMMCRETFAVHCENHAEHIHPAGRMQTYGVFKQVVNMEQLSVKEFMRRT
jgi:hypothetical protein